MNIISGLIPVPIVLIGIVAPMAFIYYWRRKERQELRESPLTRNLIRPPGHSVRMNFDDLRHEMFSWMLILFLSPLIAFSVHISQSYFGSVPESTFRTVGTMIATYAVMHYMGRQMNALLSRLKLLSLGLQGELATAEELNQLMLDGCRVFHDIPFPYGNIDHVVVSPSGVFAVNAKMLGKPKDGEGKADVVVDHLRGIIRFPDREVPIPTSQLETEVKWLKSHLASSVGQPVNVEAILALPGWFIKERIGKGPVFVINPYKPRKFFVHERRVLSPELVQQVAHQLEQLVRDVEPSFQAKRERWEDKK